MDDLKLSNLPAQTQTVIEPFLKDILTHYKEDITSIYIIGSAVTKSFHPKYSDINTVIVVKGIKFPFYDFIASLGKRYGKKHIRAPIIMTRDYINRSLEVFPLEFLEMKLIHQLVYGEDVLKDIKIEKADIRLQCERELKGKLQHLCQGYIKAMGNKMTLTDLFVGSLSGYFPLFRGILFLYNHEIPKEKGDVLHAINECCGVDMKVYRNLLDIRSRNFYPPLEALKEIFKNLYRVLDTITKKVDEFRIEHA
jgi:predicted nucleotidyltransferase